MHKRIAIIGASGYTGIELTRILSAHPRVELAALTSDRWRGDTVEDRLAIRGALGRCRYAALGDSEALSKDCDAVLLATPAEISAALAPKLLEKNPKRPVVDLSGGFRLPDAALYPKWYGFEHPAAAWLGRAVFGMPELFRAEIAKAQLVANPGCYPTASALPLAPLLKKRIIEPEGIIVDAASGTTGAGRKASEELSFAEVHEDFRAYKVLKHQHQPEIRMTLERAGGVAAPAVFTAHLLPAKRGILATIYARLKPGLDGEAARRALTEAYASEPFVVMKADANAVSTNTVLGTNQCHIGVSCEGAQLVITSAIDNLVKGAAGQAVQNLNLVLGLEETEGLQQLRGFYP